MASINLRDGYLGANTVLTGWFDGRITKAEAGVSQSSGNEMITMELQIEGGPNHGRTFRERAVLSPNGIKWFFQKMAACGLEQDFFAPADGSTPTLEHTARELVGRPIRFELGEETYQNVKREAVKNLERAGAGAVRQVPGGMPGAMPGGAPAPAAMPGAVPTPAATPAAAPAPAPVAKTETASTPKGAVPPPPTLGGDSKDDLPF
jgi:hypothetical protein